MILYRSLLFIATYLFIVTALNEYYTVKQENFVGNNFVVSLDFINL